MHAMCLQSSRMALRAVQCLNLGDMLSASPLKGSGSCSIMLRDTSLPAHEHIQDDGYAQQGQHALGLLPTLGTGYFLDTSTYTLWIQVE